MARRRPEHVIPEAGEWDLTPRPASASAVALIRAMDLTTANILGNVHGGEIMKMVDNAGGLAALKHCGGPVVTVAMDEMSFMEPVFVGDVVTAKSMVNDTGRTSVEVGVRVEAENLLTGKVVHVSSAHLVFVSIDESGKPVPLPPLIVESEEERRRMRAAEQRRTARLRRSSPA